MLLLIQIINYKFEIINANIVEIMLQNSEFRISIQKNKKCTKYKNEQQV